VGGSIWGFSVAITSDGSTHLGTVPRVHGLICDVDGVLTNGQIGFGTAGQEMLFFDVHDGLAMRLASWYGIKVAWITGRMSDPAVRRGLSLDVPVYSRIADKAVGVRIIARDLGVDLSEIAYIGDDLSDLRAMQLVGCPMAVADACPEVKRQARYITEACGGHGAVREAVETILRIRGCWDEAVDRYLQVLGEPELARSLPRSEE
jgi:3-deoxy-D-manno-octulosonate 8-phosphate phosphatase (KDO 8-P phosphatase)